MVMAIKGLDLQVRLLYYILNKYVAGNCSNGGNRNSIISFYLPRVQVNSQEE